jgi:two-component system sensor histidine kinase RpfC
MQGNTVIILTSMWLADSIEQSLMKWGIDSIKVSSCARVIAMLLDNPDLYSKVRAVIVENHDIGMQIQQFSMIFKANKKLSNISLIAYDKSSSTDIDEMYYQSGMDTVLHAPLDDRILFNALHVSRTMHKNEKLISISDRFEQAITYDSGSLRILVGEDNKTNQMVIDKILTKARHQVTVVGDGEEVLDMLTESNHYDLLLLDMNMPNYSGLDILNTISYWENGIMTPVIILTADATMETRRECMKAGALAVLTKPIEPQILFETIANCCPTRDQSQIIPPPSKNDLDKHVIINHKRLEDLRAVSDDPAFLYDLLATFCDDTKAIITGMEANIREKNIIGYRENAHALKSISANIGANYLYVISTNFLDHAKDKSDEIILTGMQKVLDQIKQGFDETHQELYQYMQKQYNASQ